MTKASETFLYLGIIVAVWLALYLDFVPVPSLIRSEIVPVLPWWALVSFGSYALFTLGFDVFTFNNKPEKYQELMQQVKTAKADLKTQGVDVSN